MLLIRGKGALDGDSTTVRSRLYRRWHGAGLLALSALGGVVLLRRQVGSEAGRSAALVLGFFHGTAVAVHAYSAFDTNNSGGIRALGDDGVSFKGALLSPHLPLAAGFAVILLAGRGAP